MSPKPFPNRVTARRSTRPSRRSPRTVLTRSLAGRNTKRPHSRHRIKRIGQKAFACASDSPLPAIIMVLGSDRSDTAAITATLTWYFSFPNNPETTVPCRCNTDKRPRPLPPLHSPRYSPPSISRPSPIHQCSWLTAPRCQSMVFSTNGRARRSSLSTLESRAPHRSWFAAPSHTTTILFSSPQTS